MNIANGNVSFRKQRRGTTDGGSTSPFAMISSDCHVHVLVCDSMFVSVPTLFLFSDLGGLVFAEMESILRCEMDLCTVGLSTCHAH
jgi:hypothetical protein